MTISDRIVAELRRSPEGLTDEQLSIRLGVLHRQVNSRCRTLELQGVVERDKSLRPLVNRIRVGGTSTVHPPAAPLPAQRDGFPEREVQAAVVRFLAVDGWQIQRVADTDAREHGTDIVATRGQRTLHVEVKGWPSTTYVRGDLTGQVKPTKPSTQAAHWYAGVLLSALRIRERQPNDEVALALPDRPRYTNLVRETASSLAAARIDVLFVRDTGDVWSSRTPDGPAD